VSQVICCPSFSPEVEPWVRRAAALVSLLTAGAAGIEALYGWGGIWIEKRRAAELLKVEGWSFLHGGGPYRGRPVNDGFPDFVTQVESQIAAEVGEYVAAAGPRRSTASPKQNDEDEQKAS